MKQTKTSAKAGVIFALCFLVFFLGMYSEYQITPVAGSLMADLGIGQGEYMKLLTFCMFPALFLSIISGSICDRFGMKKVVGAFILVSSLGIIGRIIFIHQYVPLLICSTALGLGCMMLTAANAKVLGSVFPPERLGSIIGMVTAGNTIGMLLAQSTTALLPSLKFAFIISGVLAVIVTLGWYILIKEPGESGNEMPMPTTPIGESMKVCVKNKSLWMAGLALCCVMAAQVLLTGNLPQALVGKGFTEAAAGTASSAYMVGCVIGNIVGPILFYKLRSAGGKRIFLSVCALLIGIGTAAGWMIPNTALMCLVIALSGACVSTIIPIFFAMPISLPEIGPRYAATAGGFQATVQILGATIVPTYIVTPICGSNLSLTFVIGGIIGLLSLAFIMFTPVVKAAE